MVTQVGREDEFSISRQQMAARILVALGGTVAEELAFGRDHVTSGATDDLRQATEMARHMVMQCGLNDVVGPVYVADEKSLSDASRAAVDGEVRAMLVGARAQVKALLTARMADLHLLAAALVEHETLTAEDIATVLRRQPLAKKAPAPVPAPAAPAAPAPAAEPAPAPALPAGALLADSGHVQLELALPGGAAPGGAPRPPAAKL